MSVAELERKEGRFTTTTKCRELCVYTLQITKNENIFLPEYRDVITNDINRLAKSIYTHALTANKIWVSTDEDLRLRLAHESDAIDECDELFANINVAYRLFHLKGKRVRYWSDKVTECQTLLRSWRTSDKKRYGL